MNINKHNYEAFFLDYHEGNLSPQQVADLLLFVEQHPGLKEEFESFENFNLEDFSSYTFADKDSLKKEINAQNKDEYLVRAADGTLNKAEKELLEIFLKQHPQYSVEFELFRKTKLHPDTNIFFANKEILKRSADKVPSNESSETSNLLISAVEGLLSPGEMAMLNQQLKADQALANEFNSFKRTKISADTRIVYENKNELKRDQRKVIPFYYYISAAAAVLLLFGLFFMFKNSNDQKQELAKNIDGTINTYPDAKNVLPQVKAKNNAEAVSIAYSKTVHQKNLVNKKSDAVNSDEHNNTAALIQEENHAAVNSEKIIEPSNETAIVIEENKSVNPNNQIARSEEKTKAASKEFLSLGQIAAAKIKEKTLDPEVLAMEKRSGREKRFSGWDVLQVLAKGVSKVTGKKVEAKPTYNEEGEVTAYALGAGSFQLSKGKKSN